MDESTWGFIGVLAGAIVGASASIVTTILTSNNAVRLQQNTDSQEQIERARTFQRETLLAVQNSLNDALHLMMKIYLADLGANDKGAVWRKSHIDKDIDERNRVINSNLAVLTERIADDSLREELNRLRYNIAKASLAASREEAEAVVTNTFDQAEPFIKHLGIVLRNQY